MSGRAGGGPSWCPLPGDLRLHTVTFTSHMVTETQKSEWNSMAPGDSGKTNGYKRRDFLFYSDHDPKGQTSMHHRCPIKSNKHQESQKGMSYDLALAV